MAYTNKSKIQNYLWKYLNFLDQYNFLVDEVEITRNRTSRLVSNYGFHIRGCDTGSQERAWIKFIETEEDNIEKLSKLAKNCNDALLEIEGYILKLDNPKEAKVIRSRYIKDLEFQHIADELGYSLHHIYKIHNNALEHLTSIINLDKTS